MSKKSERRQKNAERHAAAGAPKRERVKRVDRPIVARSFEGTPSECDWVALRELVPAATAPLRLKDGTDREITLATVLPMAVPAMVREDDSIFVAAQTTIPSSDPSRDIAHALLRALDAQPGDLLPIEFAPLDGPTLADILTDDPLEVTVHDDFSFWLVDADRQPPEVRASMERANDTVFPTVRLQGVEAAYWCAPGPKAHVRWPMPYDEDKLLDALARLSAAGELNLGEGTRFAGQFRGHGVLVPVWDVSIDAHPDEFEKPTADMQAKLEKAMASDEPLNEAERRARAGVIGRQVSLR
ncbi:DUF5926 family protein [Blastococcus sp. Marseille-P5729]|uniref:DUF5926 family protein n=1 Tax=Blastococcus sp. Marseille-P5729 TaxID=2086582 RepID=UPI000D0E3713|nr:DUF5926 family protein [Blastococcus sp. Marseille-P5729]